jgi:undecaprenyl phosphate N,N'-diacetylbacillosamine 1-phosphate transferase
MSPEAPSRAGRERLSLRGQAWQFGPLVGWMLVMAVFSGHLGSQETMRDAISWLLRPFFPGAAGQHLGQAVPGSLLWTVRKLAHLTEYAVLALLARRWLGSLTPQTRRVAWGALLLCLFYAVADETHQASVPGRTSSGWDVTIDVTGAALALALARLRQAENHLFVYRLCDLAGACMGLVLTFPFLLLGGLGVWITMGRPVLFRQERVGLNERVFTLLKLRTMREERDAEGRSRPGRARITRFGRLLRSLSVDEFPQFWNVLRGDMSLVGPRPLFPKYLAYYTPRERTRHLVRPGVTGLAQISGRNSLTWDDRLELDAQYVERKSLRFDLRLLLRTVGKVLRRSDVGDEPLQGALSEHRAQLLPEQWGAR